MSRPIANKLKATDIQSDQTHCFSYTITEKRVEQFAELSGDYNPLHNDPDYAKSVGHSGCVVHGVFQQALASQAVGMWAIGERCLIAGMETHFESPLVYPAEVQVKSRILRWSSDNATGQVEVQIWDLDSLVRFSTTKLQVTFHGAAAVAFDADQPDLKKVASTAHEKSANPETARPLLVVTGATGGVMQAVLPALADCYDLILLGRRQSVLDEIKDRLSSRGSAQVIAADLIEGMEDAMQAIEEARNGRSVFGVLHAASTKPSTDSVHEWEQASFTKELLISTYLPSLLARWLKTAVGEDGGRLILMGSNYAIHNAPELKLLRYGVSKSCMSAMMKALALELAGSRITVNSISPDFIPFGMNAGMHPRMLRMKEVSNPMKRLCQPEDVLSAIQYLLSESSGFLSGEEMVISGGKL